MNKTIPRIVFGSSVVAAVLAVLNGLFWYATVVLDHDGRGSVGFMHLVFPMFGGGFLLLLVGSGVLYRQSRQRRDLASFILSSASLSTIVCELIAQSFVPLHGPW